MNTRESYTLLAEDPLCGLEEGGKEEEGEEDHGAWDRLGPGEVVLGVRSVDRPLEVVAHEQPRGQEARRVPNHLQWEGGASESHTFSDGCVERGTADASGTP